MRGIIYKWTNLLNNKVYVGKTINEKRRKWQHLKERRYKSALHDALDKYGVENFKYEVIFETRSADRKRIDCILNTLERYYIRKYHSNHRDKGYNLTEGGDGVTGRFGELNPFYGKHTSEENKKRQSKLIKSIYDKVHSPEARKKQIESLKKVVHTKEWNEKVSRALSKPVEAYKDGILVGSYKSYKDCAEALNLPNWKGISKVTTGYRKTYNGYTFRKINKEETQDG